MVVFESRTGGYPELQPALTAQHAQRGNLFSRPGQRAQRRDEDRGAKQDPVGCRRDVKLSCQPEAQASPSVSWLSTSS